MDTEPGTWEQGRFAAAVLLKVSRAIPLYIADMDHVLVLAEFNTLLLRTASLLPSHDATGFGTAQHKILRKSLLLMRTVARQCMLNPLSKMSIAVIDLLREFARDSDAMARERSFAPTGALKPEQYRVHRYAVGTPTRFADGLAKTELLYEALLEGLRKWANLGSQWDAAVDASVWHITKSMVLWVPALLFDGLRLREGLHIAAECGVVPPGQRQPFGLDTNAEKMLSDGETRNDRERVGRTAQFVLAAALAGWEAYGGGEEERKHWEYARQVVCDLASELTECRKEHEQHSPRPGKSMRIVLDKFADIADSAPYYEQDMKLLQMAFAFPCLLPHNLMLLNGYDGGLLSVWDACNHLLCLNAQEKLQVPSIQELLCSVLGGVVMSLLSDEPVGPFYVSQRSVLRYMDKMSKSWPGSCLASQEETSSPARYRASSRAEHRGKSVSATSALLDALSRDAYKSSPRATDVVDARFDAALVMRVVSYNLGRHRPGMGMAAHPTDGIVALKRLYFAALHNEPWMPEKEMVPPGGGSSYPSSPLVEVCSGGIPGSIPPSAIETPWREVVGGACLVCGPLFAFSRQGFKESLENDWRPRPEVQRALQARDGDTSERAKAVMPASWAMLMMSERAQKHVATTVTSVDNDVKTNQGPPYVVRVAELLNMLSNVVYPGVVFNPLWESSIIHFCSVLQPKRKRDDRISPVIANSHATINEGSGVEV